ncbi:hypothetical protein [Alcanivorax sp.]|jgi:uncharacterized membrane protein|uniref:hypothetical protein n=1 Tax=Alcanivorax sp. TaxID=1872427 RepID=UPI0032D94F12
MKGKYIAVGLLALLSAAVAVLPYLYSFSGRPISTVPVEWGAFGAYFGGVLSPILSFFALVGLLLTLHETNATNSRQWEYLRANEKKREWQLVIEHAESQIRRLVSKHVQRNDGQIFELGSALNQIRSKIQSSDGVNGDREHAQSILSKNWSPLELESFSGLCNLLGSLSIYIEQYSYCLMKENREEIVGHYLSSYFGYVSSLQWMGIMKGQDSERWASLLTTKYGQG